MLHCATLCYAMLHYTILYLHYARPLPRAVPMLHYAALHYAVLQYRLLKLASEPDNATEPPTTEPIQPTANGHVPLWHGNQRRERATSRRKVRV